MAREPILRDTLEQYLAEVNRYPLLSREQEYKLAKRYQETGDPEAARALVTANLRFVVKIAYQFKHYDIKLTDLVQEGNIGLMKAVAKFRPDRGYRLISYAVWWIKAYIQNYIINSWSLVKVGPVAQQRRVLFGRRGLPSPEEMEAGGKAGPADVGGDELAGRVGGEKEPVAPPGDVAADRPEPLDLQAHAVAVAEGGDVVDRRGVGVVEIDGDRADRRLDAVPPFKRSSSAMMQSPFSLGAQCLAAS